MLLALTSALLIDHIIQYPIPLHNPTGLSEGLGSIPARIIDKQFKFTGHNLHVACTPNLTTPQGLKQEI